MSHEIEFLWSPSLNQLFLMIFNWTALRIIIKWLVGLAVTVVVIYLISKALSQPISSMDALAVYVSLFGLTIFIWVSVFALQLFLRPVYSISPHGFEIKASSSSNQQLYRFEDIDCIYILHSNIGSALKIKTKSGNELEAIFPTVDHEHKAINTLVNLNVGHLIIREE